MPPVLEVLVGLSRDDYPIVSSMADLSLTTFSQQFSREEDSFELTAVMEERLHSLASSLPRFLRSQSDVGKVSTLQLLTGYLKLLQYRVGHLVNSQAHLSRILQALVMVSEYEGGMLFNDWTLFCGALQVSCPQGRVYKQAMIFEHFPNIVMLS